MKRTDIDADRIKGSPTNTRLIFEGAMENQGYMIKRISLREYAERHDNRLGSYSLLTVVVETDKGSVEMKYDEGFRGPDALESAANMLQKYAGLASLINRALIELAR